MIIQPQDFVSPVGFVVFVGAAPCGCPTVYRGNVLYHTISVYSVTACRGVLYTPLPNIRGFSSICSVTQYADVVLFALDLDIVAGDPCDAACALTSADLFVEPVGADVLGEEFLKGGKAFFGLEPSLFLEKGLADL